MVGLSFSPSLQHLHPVAGPIRVLAALFPTQLLLNVLAEAAEGALSAWGPTTHFGDLNGGSRPQALV